jgi:hypothetical protein
LSPAFRLQHDQWQQYGMQPRNWLKKKDHGAGSVTPYNLLLSSKATPQQCARLERTVKASNFGPHGNLGHFFFFQKGLLLSKCVLQKNGWNKSCRQLSICKVGSVHFCHGINPEKLRILQEVVQTFHEVQS